MFPVVLIAPLVLVSVILFFVVRPLMRMRAMTRAAMPTGQRETATVISSVQTGTSSSGVPQWEVVLDVLDERGTPRRVISRHTIGLPEIPQPGHAVYVMQDPRKKGRYIILPGRPSSSETPTGSL